MKMEFENALQRLEEIVRRLEEEELSLEESIKQYEEGTRLARFCQEKLDAAEKKIEILKKSEDDDNPRLEPFESEETGENEEV